MIRKFFSRNALFSLRTFFANALLIFCLCAPLLLFNGYGWLSTPFLFKWLGAFLPTAYLAGFLGAMILFGKKAGGMDAFSAGWILIVAILPLQLFFPDLPNATEWVRSWFFFAGLGGAYLAFRNFFSLRFLPAALRTLLWAGGISTVFGFLQQARATRSIRFIMDSPLPDRFFANTAMDSILAVVLALACFSGVWLLVGSRTGNRETGAPAEQSVVKKEPELQTKGLISPSKKRILSIFFVFHDGALLALNLVGLWKAAARSSHLAFLFALIVFGISLFLRGRRSKPASAGRRFSSAFFARALAVLLAVVVITAALPYLFPVQRRDIAADFSLQGLTPEREGRFAIWGLTIEMIKERPLLGTGLGNFKWRYLDTLPAFYRNWDLKARYTHWAHNEYLQWTAETGAVGALLLAGLLVWWAVTVLRRFKGRRIAYTTLWGVGALALLSVDAFFSRPFHHVESAIWLPFALAVVNSEALPDLSLRRNARIFLGSAVTAVAAFGIFAIVQSLPVERQFAWISHPRMFMLVRGEDEVPLPESPLLLRDRAKEVRWKRSLMRARTNDKIEFYHEAARHLEDDFATRPRFEIFREMVEVYGKLGNTERMNELLLLLPPERRGALGKGL